MAKKSDLKFRDPVRVECQAADLGGFTVQGMDDPEAEEVKIAGYAARYNTEFRVWAMPGFVLMRRQEQGSFARSLAQKPKVMMRLNHQEAFASTKAGTLELSETEEGLWYEAMISKKNPQALAMLVELERGTLTESSVAYQVVRAAYEEKIASDGTVTRTQIIQEGSLQRGDVSVVQYGMNSSTSSGIVQGLLTAQSLAVDAATAAQVQALIEGREPPPETAGEDAAAAEQSAREFAQLRRKTDLLTFETELAAARAGVSL